MISFILDLHLISSSALPSGFLSPMHLDEIDKVHLIFTFAWERLCFLINLEDFTGDSDLPTTVSCQFPVNSSFMSNLLGDVYQEKCFWK